MKLKRGDEKHEEPKKASASVGSAVSQMKEKGQFDLLQAHSQG